MNILVIDMTHGGALIASEYSKIEDYNVFALDIYKTLSQEKKALLIEKGIEFVGVEFLDKIENNSNIETGLNNEFLVIAPVHCNIESKVHMTHHEAVKILLEDKINVPIIEVTGVKGKTSVLWMLKEIFKDLNPLILSSLGVEIIENGKSTILKRDISITPASIIDSLEIAKDYNIGICLFETSLGGTGLADVGVLTNIAENYPIASGEKTASHAKTQIFKNDIIVCDFDAYNQYYSHIDKNINTFGINPNATVNASKINYSLDKTTFEISVNDLKTKKGAVLNASFNIKTFAPAKHHVLNVICAVCAALSLDTPINQIIDGLKDFEGVEGRTSIKNHENIKIIEEINPGINVTAIKKSVGMIENSESPTVVFGGKYGVTCEEIDEKSTAEFFNKMDEKIKLILIDELGKNVSTLIKRKFKYTDLNNAIEEAVQMNSKMILLIYRSNFSDISRR
jgi:UDP-N-acetylmuramyl pentapeptide synthase